ncbi:MAG: T9SS type A sorting domain-containing protein [Bacteroidales bacterium]|nr:T9SS type A sorting domain-containing protein [Bacteroidales bacterium]
MDETYPDTWIGIAVHNGDPMVVTEYDNAVGDLISGYPSGLVDREADAEYDPSAFEAAYLEKINNIPPVALSIINNTWNPTTRVLSFEVEGYFVASISGADLRFNAVIMENGVTGTASGYNQANYYSGGANGPMGGYESLPNPVPAAQMVYNNVARAILGGFEGSAASIPATIVADNAYSQAYTYTIPAAYNENNIVIVGMVIDNATGEIMNGVKSDISVGFENNILPTEVVIYPNPSNGILNVRNAENSTITVYNVLGEVVISVNNAENLQMINLTNQPEGTYIVKIENNNSVVTQKFILNK